MKTPVCGPVGKISNVFFFVSDQLELSGPFVGSIILAHYGAHTVAYQRGNESLCLSGRLHVCVCVCVCVYVCVLVLQEARPQVSLFSAFTKIGRRKMFHDSLIDQCH